MPRVLDKEIKQDGLLIMHGHLAPTRITYQMASGKSDLGTVARALDDHTLEAVKSRGGEAEDSSELGESGSDEREEESYAPTLPTVTLDTAGALKSTRLLI
jgi:hypothetical protein